MIVQLYDCFKHWTEKGSLYIISDTHFDDNDCKLMCPTWITPIEHLEVLKKITKNDTLICLGDCGNLEYFKKIKGHKVLIKGNHDDKGDYFYKKEITKEIYDADTISERELRISLKEKYPNCFFEISESFEFHSPFHRWNVSIDNNLFDEVYSGPLFIGEKILLSHEPISLPFVLNIHGHNHSGEFIHENEFGIKSINLASNVCGFKLFDLGKEIKNGLLKDIDSIHRITIDNATEKKNKKSN